METSAYDLLYDLYDYIISAFTRLCYGRSNCRPYKNRLFIKMTQNTLKHNNFNEVRAYLRNVLITELMTNKNGMTHCNEETSSSPLQSQSQMQ